MDIQTEHRVKLLNAKCEYVCAVENLSKKLDYGDDIECCLNKLFLASKLINRLDCYCFSENNGYTTISTGTCTAIVDSLSEVSFGDYILTSNGNTLSSFTVGTATTYAELVATLLGLASITFSQINIDRFTTVFSIIIDCNQTSLEIKKDNSLIIAFDNQQLPVCETNYTECYNCIEDSNLREMYAVLDQLLS